MELSQLTEMLGWISILNISYLFLASLVLTFMRESILSIHGKIFDIDDQKLKLKYFNFLSTYKIVTLVFCITPYVALKIMGQ